MRCLLIATTALSLLVMPISTAFAKNWKDRDDDRGGAMMKHDGNGHGGNGRHDNGRHRGWYKGGHIERGDWDRGVRIYEYRRYSLSPPPRGYEWRRVDDNYVLAAAATGLIMGLVLANQ
jgi:Ni/Co efflux regulator RcnB